ncbi:hypothetical protein RJT34_11726 [Clitoria ternatea]|uniref:Exocyst subunit Exo70 family protein n=1 Tax=Clitoria ternatea TaxID=43366 RepID=A0AAN9PIP5_CLITE
MLVYGVLLFSVLECAYLSKNMVLVLIQIPRRPKLWRFVCLTSSVVGLLCYALSSSFSHLFGKWIWWKILLYIAFSFIICLAVLYAKVWQASTTLRLKAHLAFLVLIITSIYSFFLDKEVKGKPDAYSLVSLASFAVMSLCLTRQSHCGFEVDLLYFFSGCLIVQLMKINLWFVTVGGSFSYSLIILRSSLDSVTRNGYLEAHDQVDLESGLHSQPHGRIENEDLGFLVTEVNLHSSQEGNNLIMAQFIGCIVALKKETGNLIDTVSKHVEEYLKANVDLTSERLLLHPDDNLVVDFLVPLKIIDELHDAVKLMVVGGFEDELSHVYSSCRREFLEQFLSTFKLQELNTEGNVERWIKASNIALKILFPNEKRLCSLVFRGFVSAEDVSFEEACRDSKIQLMSLANTLTGSNSLNFVSSFAPKMRGALHILVPQLECLVPGEQNASLTLRKDLHTIWMRLYILMQLNILTYRDEVVQVTVLDGGVHPITEKVMNYLWDFFLGKNSLIWGKLNGEGKPSISEYMRGVMEVLQGSLEAKSKNYTDPTLSCIFMVNNLKYIEQMVRKYGLRATLGGDWFQNITAKGQDNLKLYQRCSWNKMLDLLKLDNESMASMKDKLNLFNQQFKEICNIQSTWFVFEEQLRKRIIVSIEDILLPAYGNFIGKFQDFLGKQSYDYIEYGIFDIQDQLNNLFLVSERMNPMPEGEE